MLHRAGLAVRIMIIGAAVALLSGCAGWGFSGSGGGKTVTLTYALWDPHEQVGYQQSINEFEKLHPDIKGQVAMWEEGDWNTLSVKSSVTFPVGVATLPIGPQARGSVFNGLIDGLNSHTPYPKQAWELEQWLGSPQSQAILGSGGYVWPAIKSLDPLFLQYWKKQGIDMSAFLTEAHGKVVSFPVSPASEMRSPRSSTISGRPGWARNR